jgi:ribonuclease P protein component
MSIETGRFRRSDRLLDSRDYRRVLRRGRRRAHRDLVVIMTSDQKIPNKTEPLAVVEPAGSRLGITASRKVGGAVVRNRFKRRVRAWFRARRQEFSEDVDLVVIARRSGARLTFAELDQRLSGLLGLPAAASHQADRQDGVSRGAFA